MSVFLASLRLSRLKNGRWKDKVNWVKPFKPLCEKVPKRHLGWRQSGFMVNKRLAWKKCTIILKQHHLPTWNSDGFRHINQFVSKHYFIWRVVVFKNCKIGELLREFILMNRCQLLKGAPMQSNTYGYCHYYTWKKYVCHFYAVVGFYLTTIS